jgi:deoxyguanosine kinase
VEQYPLIADYTFAKDALFARINLRGDDLALYHRLHDALAEKILPPDLIVYLRAPTLDRIALRGRPYERQMDPAYIAALGGAYDDYFTAADGPRGQSPVLTLDTERLDFVNNPDHLRQITQRIQAALGIGAVQVPLPWGGAG